MTIYIGTLLSGFSIGFSAVSIPDIKEERNISTANQTEFPLRPMEASNEELSWFGKELFYK